YRRLQCPKKSKCYRDHCQFHPRSHGSRRARTTNTTTSPCYECTEHTSPTRTIYHPPTSIGSTSSTSSSTSSASTTYHSTSPTLHGTSTGNTATTKTTTTISAAPSGKTTTTTERVRFNAGDAVYRLKDGKAQKGVIQSIGQVGKWTTPVVKWNNIDKPENARFNKLKKDNHPVTTTVVKSTAKGPGPMELDGKGMSGITCYRCRGKGHTADVCPSKGISGHEAQIVEVESEEESGKGGAETA
ncbi:hypothetical protein V565_240080, partial [Rhizoctonia solani 123E]